MISLVGRILERRYLRGITTFTLGHRLRHYVTLNIKHIALNKNPFSEISVMIQITNGEEGWTFLLISLEPFNRPSVETPSSDAFVHIL